MNLKKIILICIFIALSGCSVAHQPLYLYTGKLPAYLKPSEYIDILKIDDTLVKVKAEGAGGTIYSCVALAPGKHTVVVKLPWFEKGNIFFLNVFVIGGRQYVIKYKVGDRVSYFSSKWYIDAWVEDAITGEKVSSTIRNL